MRSCHLVALLSVLAACPPVAGAAEQELEKLNEAPWRIVLRDQLKSEKSCDLNEVLTYQELPLGDEVALDGRISCIDGREFDFSRKRPHQKFSIELCKPTVC